MDFYYVTRPLTLYTETQSKTLRPPRSFATPATTDVHLAAQREIELVRSVLIERDGGEPLHGSLRLLGDADLAGLPELPMALGAPATDPNAPSSPAPLATQLATLRERWPGRQHFRILLPNAFGINLGDNLVGLTAFRQVLAVLREHLPAVSVDVMLGWHRDDGLDRLFAAEGGIDGRLGQGLTVAALSRYQAVFDTSGLLTLPRYGRMPMVDWYLWWMGLDPAAVDATDKRNAIRLAPEAVAEIAAMLPPSPGRRVLVNPRASVALRGLPDAACRRLVERLVADLPDAQIVLTRDVGVADPRVLVFAEPLRTIDHLAALMAAVDGLVGVDTYTQHLADATGTPAVTLFSSVSPDLYPYYPNQQSMLLPGAENLPCWGRMKTDADEWSEFAPRYESAWLALDPGEVVAALTRLMARGAPPEGRGRVADGDLVGRQVETDGLRLLRHSGLDPESSGFTVDSGVHRNDGRIDRDQRDCLRAARPPRQREDALAAVLHRTVIRLAEQRVKVGDAVILLGSGSGETALDLARRVGPQGRLCYVEPRRELFQSVCARLHLAGVRHAETHAVMPEGAGLEIHALHRLRVDDDFQAGQLANTHEPETVVAWPLDALAPEAARLLVICSPLPILSVLRGATSTLRRLRPVLVAGVLRGEDQASLTALLAPLAYRTRFLGIAEAGGAPDSARFGILLAEPEAAA